MAGIFGASLLAGRFSNGEIMVGGHSVHVGCWLYRSHLCLALCTASWPKVHGRAGHTRPHPHIPVDVEIPAVDAQ